MRAGALTERVAFDEPTGGTNAFGGTTEAWTERHVCAAGWLSGKGDEAVQAARLAGRQVRRLVIRKCDAADAITAGYRMRDVRKGTEWNITFVDADTDPYRRSVFITVEGVQA